MPEIDPTYEPRPWLCDECRAVLGYVVRSADRVRRLWLLRVQVPAGKPVLPAQEVLAAAQLMRHNRQGLWRAHGIDAAQGICCDACGSIQNWRPSDESLRSLIHKVRGDSGLKLFEQLSRQK